MTGVNFRNLGHVEVEFDEGIPIIALRGNNESGKSSVIKLVGTVGGNLWRTKQNRYVKTGASGFAGLLQLEDGTKVVRKRTKETNSYSCVLSCGTRRDANKLENEIPDFIAAVMGFARDRETKASLQVRTYEDPLLFVTTTDGENYKIINNAISNLEVRDASIAAKADATKLGGVAEVKRNAVNVYQKQAEEVKLFNTENMEVLLGALKRADEMSDLFNEALEAKVVVDSFNENTAAKLAEIEGLDVELITLFTEAVQSLNEVRAIKTADVNALETLDIQVLTDFTEAVEFLNEARGYKARAVPDEVRDIDVTVITDFMEIIELKKQIAELTASINKKQEGIDKVDALLKASGANVVACDKCGNDVVFMATVGTGA
jgi:hypothetical protein